MNPDHPLASVTLPDGDRLLLRLPRGAAALTLTRERDGRVLDLLTWPYPAQGFGGGALTLSPSGRLVLFSYFSGQSEEAYAVVSVDGPLREVGACAYQIGEAASYAFSPDERWLLMALPATCTEWWLPFVDDELAEDERGAYLDFARLLVQRVGGSAATVHAIRAYPPDAWQPPDDATDADLHPAIDDCGRVRLRLPWGEVVLDPPLPPVLRLDLPPTPRALAAARTDRPHEA